jgi:hypothetical protein
LAFLPPRVERFVNEFPENGQLVPFTRVFHDLIDRVSLIHPGTETIDLGLRHHSSFAHAVFTGKHHSKGDSLP